jgi:hypothetical protein
VVEPSIKKTPATTCPGYRNRNVELKRGSDQSLRSLASDLRLYAARYLGCA